MDNPIQRKPNMTAVPDERSPMMPPRGPRPPMASPGSGAMAMTPKEILGVVRRHIWMIILLTLVGVIIGGGSWFLCNRYLPRYTSIRPIDVDPPIEIDPMQIAGAQVPKDIYYQFRVTKASLVKQEFMLRQLLEQSEAVRTTSWYQQFEKADSQGTIDRASAIDEALKSLNDNLGSTAPRDYNYILISMTCANPRDAQVIVDEMVRVFLRQQQELAQSGLKEELVQRNAQRESIQATIDSIENDLKTLRTGTTFARLNLGSQQAFRDYMDQHLADLESQTAALQRDRMRLATTVSQLQARADAFDYDERVREEIENDPVARQMRANIAALEPVLDRQLARFGEDHRLVRETQAALQQMRDQLSQRQYEIGNILRQSNLLAAHEEMASLTNQLEISTQQLDIAKKEYKDIDRIRTDYERSEQKRQESLDRLEEMNTLIEKKRAQHDDPKISKLSSPYSATLPREKSFPNPFMFFPGGFILGLMAGLGLAFLIELGNDLLRTPSDVMRNVKVPLMGMVCHVDDDEDVDGIDIYHVVRQAPYSITSECYRQLRTNLRLAGSEAGANKAIFVTSSNAGDGKTTVAVNLASTLLAEGRSVLLIDANFRRPSTGRLFPRSRENGSADFPDYGLSNYLMGQCSDENQVVRNSNIEGLSIIDSGPLPANPSELFSGIRMKKLLDLCKSRFDYVIIDGPAMLVSDSKTLAAQSDGTIVVFNATSTQRGTAIRILRELNEANANVIGSVLMAVKSRKGGYFSEVYRSYQEYQRVHVEHPVI